MKPGRRQQILEVLARELESRPGARMTTAALAAAVGVSESALYRHFPSKARMFEALIEFAEESVFGLVTRILQEETSASRRCAQIGHVVLGFAARNPGISRILVGDILLGEHARLRARVVQFFERLEAQFRQVLREAAVAPEAAPVRATIPAAANLICAVLLGRLAQFVRSGYRQLPDESWEAQWAMLARGVFPDG